MKWTSSTVKNQQLDIVEYTIAFWSARTEQEVSREDARQMLVNVSGFFQLLAEWDKEAAKDEQKGMQHEGPSTTRRVDK
jgi:hypothetical protein